MRKATCQLLNVKTGVLTTDGTWVAMMKPNATPRKEATLSKPNIRPRWCTGNVSDKKDCAMGNIPPLANPIPARQPRTEAYEGAKLRPIQKQPHTKHSVITMRFCLPCDKKLQNGLSRNCEHAKMNRINPSSVDESANWASKLGKRAGRAVNTAQLNALARKKHLIDRIK